MTDNILEVNHLSVCFELDHQTTQAVNAISFQVGRGQTLGIVGESGSGKSVTALAVMGLVPSPPGRLTQGEIWLHQRHQAAINLCALSEAERQGYRGGQVAMIFQEPMSSLNPVYTIGFQVIEAIRQHQSVTPLQAQQQAIARLQEVKLLPPEENLRQEILATSPGLGDGELHREINGRYQALLNRYPHELSGGQLQRVMIAIAIAGDPALLIADEPTTALDVTVQATILDLLRELRDRRGMALMFITHDLGIIAEIADQVVVMYRGEIVEKGPVLEIFSHPRHPYTRGLLACRPRLDQRLQRLPTVADFMAVTEGEGPGLVQDTPPSAVAALPFANLTEADLAQRDRALNASGPLVVVEHLQVGYPVRGSFGHHRRYVMAVKDVSFHIRQGETFGLVGESGCGKTTLARALLRLVAAQAGRIWFEGQDVLALKSSQLRRLRRQMQIIFQDPFSALDPRMTVGAAIAEPLKVHGVGQGWASRRQRVTYLLERVGLPANCLNRFPHEFSGGQRQRICIARALALNPKFIICDESVSALDVSVQAQVLNLLKEIQREFKLTYIFISHDLGVVKFMSDRIMVMNQGRVEEISEAETLYRQPQSAYTQQLINAIPVGSLERIAALQNQRQLLLSA
ncbi:MAG: ABC transporter ATP-binding protein [Cyanobacteria bacterium REEB459]|nr:ABC transporter ATP-binding protein [Cyanobacteria bacterium REEB459]